MTENQDKVMPQLNAYHRPTSVDEALQLLARPSVNSAVVAGGTYIIPHLSEMVSEVIDLQRVGLTNIDFTGRGVTLGAMVRLQTIVDDHRNPDLLREAAHREGPNTLRNAATIGGVVASPYKESELLAALLVLDARIEVQNLGDTKTISLADFLLDVPAALSGGLVTSISLTTLGKTASARVGRTPADVPIVAAVARLTEDDQIRLALCGVDRTPILVDLENVKAAVNPTSDFRGSTEYRRQMAATLAKRVVRELRETELS
jgi:probable selenate reductase FAD-binding subunit